MVHLCFFPFKDQGGFKRYFDSTISDLGMERSPTKARHTFRSRLDNKNANKVSIDLLMGHSSKESVTVYIKHKAIKVILLVIVSSNKYEYRVT